MITRKAKLQPWYHVAKPRCETLTLAKNQCHNSATCYIKPPGEKEYPACNLHAAMTDYPVTMLAESTVTVREDY